MSIISAGGNVTDDSSCPVTQSSDVQTDPGLAALGDNGGPTATHGLPPGSVALSRGTDCPSADQRGAPRSSPCSSGAYELVLCKAIPNNRIGTEDDDTIIGTEGNDGFLALGGNDVAVGMGGNDALCMCSGNDIASGGPGNDRLEGESGKDRLRGGSGRDRLQGGPGRDVLNGQKGRDTCIGGSGKDRATKCEKERKVP